MTNLPAFRPQLRPLARLAQAALLTLLAACASTGPATQPPVAVVPPPPPPVSESAEAPLPDLPGPPALQAPTVPGQIRVGMVVPLSGPAAPIGRALLDAAEMALFDIGEERLLLMPRDSQGTPDGARAATEALLAEGAQAILGPLFAASVAAAAPAAQQRGVPLFSFSNDRSVAGNGTWLLGFAPAQQVEHVLGYARSRGLMRVGALVPDNAYGAAVRAALEQAAARLGQAVVRVETYPPDGDLTPVVRRFARYDLRRAALVEQRQALAGKEDEISRQALRRLEAFDTLGEFQVDAVLLAEGGPRLRALAPLLPFFDVDPKRVRFLGTGLWDEAGLGTEPALVGGWFPTTQPLGNAEFRQRFESAFGYRPPRLAALGYDALALVASLARAAPEAPFAPEAIANPDGFAGYEGIFRFRPDGVAERGLAIVEVLPRGLRTIDPAPESFQLPAN